MYFNTLIIMNEDTSGYGRRSRSPSGYCKLTMPNRVICYVQGLQQLPKGQVYRLYLMSQSKQQSVEVGMFQVGTSGNRELRWTVTPQDINNSGITAGEIDGALVIVDGEGARESVVPLVGFAAESYSWKDIISPPEQEKSQVTQVQVEPISEVQVVEVAEVPQESATQEIVLGESIVGDEPLGLLVAEEEPLDETLEEQVQNVVALAEEMSSVRGDTRDMELEEKTGEIASLKGEVERLNKIIEQSNEIIESLQRNIVKDELEIEPELRQEVEPEPEPEPEPEAVQQNELGNLEELEAFIRKFQASTKEAHVASNGVLEKVFAAKIPMNPFPDANDGVKWVRITHEDLASFSHLPSEWANQPFILDAHRKYKHFILGRDEVGSAYYLGIPDVFSPEKNYILDTDKIERFRCRNRVPLKTGEVGYWIALM